MQIATKLAADKERLRGFRANLRQDFLKSPLGDGPRYQRNVEAMYEVGASRRVSRATRGGREEGREGGRACNAEVEKRGRELF